MTRSAKTHRTDNVLIRTHGDHTSAHERKLLPFVTSPITLGVGDLYFERILVSLTLTCIYKCVIQL